jgi:hypothetical protein
MSTAAQLDTSSVRFRIDDSRTERARRLQVLGSRILRAGSAEVRTDFRASRKRAFGLAHRTDTSQNEHRKNKRLPHHRDACGKRLPDS